MDALLPPLEHVCCVGIEHAATPKLPLPGRSSPPFEPVAHGLLGHAHPLSNRDLGEALCPQRCHLTKPIIAAGLACLMGHFDMRWRALLPRCWSGKGTSRVLRCLGGRQLISVVLTNLSTTVRQDFLQDLCQIANEVEAVHHLSSLGRTSGGCFGKILAPISDHEFDLWMHL